jgi:hypothetical protein
VLIAAFVPAHYEQAGQARTYWTGNNQRRTNRAHAWQQHTTHTHTRAAAYQRLTTTTQQAAQRKRSRDQGYGLEL